MKANGRVYKSGTGMAFNVPMDVIKKLNIKPGNRLDLDIHNPDPSFVYPKRKKEEQLDEKKEPEEIN